MPDEVTMYRDRAAQERQAASDATLANVRERCERAAGAWTAMADRAQRISDQRRVREADTAAKRLADD